MDPTQHAHVTLDALHPGVMWGWFVTMNFWAKSIGTGVALVGVYMLRRYAQSDAFYRKWLPLIGFGGIAVTLLFTVLDLHQPFRFWHMFVWPHLTSSINLGAFLLSAYIGLLGLMLFAWWKHRDRWFDLLLWPAAALAFGATVYTAGLLGQANAREVWSGPAEVAQTVVAATLAGSAVYLLFGSLTNEERLSLAWVLGLSAVMALALFGAELWLAPQKSEEAEWVMHQLLSGPLRTLFVGGLVLGFVVPSLVALLSVGRGEPMGLRLAAVCGLAGLWMVKHAWLIAPQLMPLS